jgi:pyridoxal phosphate enzyme (YggS family)
MNKPLERLNSVRQRIRAACKVCGRQAEEISLLAVSKKHPPERIRALHELGVSSFGENQLQEALQKQGELADLDLDWHFIGAIQSNKTRAIAEHFQWAQGIDRQKTLNRLSAQRPDSQPPLNICLQVNIDREHQKAGADPEDIMKLAELAQASENIKLRGLMAIPMATDDPIQQHDSFRRVKLLFDELIQAGHEMDTLSMGMSSDLEIAIAQGSTMVRIGTDLLGKRKT